MGIFDVHARSWQAPSREEQAHKSELHTLEEAEERKRRQMKHELETLRKVEGLQQESKEDARHMLEANARNAARRRAISGLDDREALLLAQREHNSARLRNVAAYPHSQVQLSPHMAMQGSPALSNIGSVPSINVPPSPGLLSFGLNVNPAATPRLRTVSALHPRPAPGLAVFPPLGAHQTTASIPQNIYSGSPALSLPLPRPRAVSSVGLGNPATVERVRLEERKRALMQREAEVQASRENRLKAKENMLDLEAQEMALRKKAQELDARSKLESRERFLDNQEAHLNRRQEQLLEAEMAERLRQLAIDTSSLNPLHASPSIGHTRHLSTPGLNTLSPHMSSLHDSALLAASSLGDGYLSGTAYPAVSRQRARSIGQSPLLGTHALDAGMAGEAARLGILPVGLGVDGLGTGNLTGLNEGVAAYAQPGVSPRFGPVGSFYDSPYDSGTHASESSNYNRLQALGLDGLGGSHLDPGYGASMGSRIRRDSLPFQY